MMTQQLGFSVLSAPLAAIDRRALSQAWYSALHLAHDGAPSAVPAFETPASASKCKRHAPASATMTSAPTSAPKTRVQTEHQMNGRAPVQSDRRAARSPLARKIERAFLHPALHIRRATFSVGESGARVHITLQGSAATLRLVAVCGPSSRASVARALEEARYVLASRGLRLGVVVRER